MWQDDSFTDEVMMKLKAILPISQIHYLSEFGGSDGCFRFSVAHYPMQFIVCRNKQDEVNEIVKKGVGLFVNYILDIWGTVEGGIITVNPIQAPAGDKPTYD